MSSKKGYKSIPLSFNRKTVIASASVTKQKNAFHSFTEIDITEPRRILKQHYERTGEKLSFTAYIVLCLANTVKDHPHINSFIKGRQLILLDDITISVLVERELGEEKVPEPVVIKSAQTKSYRQINNEIRDTKKHKSDKLGSLSGNTWIRFVPGFLMKTFVKIADRNISMAKAYGKIGVTAVGMFSKEAVWFIPHGPATVLITVGSISSKVIETDGRQESREHLCLTASFDHNIVDGAPASRFMNQFISILKNGDLIRKELERE